MYIRNGVIPFKVTRDFPGTIIDQWTTIDLLNELTSSFKYMSNMAAILLIP